MKNSKIEDTRFKKLKVLFLPYIKNLNVLEKIRKNKKKNKQN